MANKITKEELNDLRMNPDKGRKFTNGEITVFWIPDRCIHSANCLIGLPDVFNSRKQPWINVHAANSKEIVKVIDTCPSRALLYQKSPKFLTTKPKKSIHKKTKFARVQILRNGPALITGNFIIRDPEKKKIKIEHEVAALCRCGASKKKPFCDGSHQKAGFRD